MSTQREKGINTLIIDYKENEFSEILLGIIMRASVHEFKIAIVDTNNTSSKYIQILENLSLSKQFKRNFNKLHIEIFTKKQRFVTKTLLPAVEYQTITEEMMYKQLYNYDIILIDHPSPIFFNHSKTQDLLKEKKETTEIVITSSSNVKKSNYELFDEIFEQHNQQQNSLITTKTITLLDNHPFGDLYNYGVLFKEFSKKEQVKYITFDKGDLFYGEHIFFRALKEWKKNNNSYGDFDYLITGQPRHLGPSVREEFSQKDRNEIIEGIQLLKTALNKQSPIIVDNIDDAIKYNTLHSEELYNTIIKAQRELYITTTILFETIKPIAGDIITFSCLKKIHKQMKKGIDY